MEKIEKMLHPHPETLDSAYHEWLADKIAHAAEEMSDPANRIPERDVWREFGFED